LEYQTALERFLIDINSKRQYVAVFLDEAEGLDTYMLDLVYLTPSFKKALHMITNTLDNRQGISCIFGDIGMGKSSLLRFLHAEYLSCHAATN
jgi:type II secretory pathway predicted ATPase ExeA